jgi:hypothetical protein
MSDDEQPAAPAAANPVPGGAVQQLQQAHFKLPQFWAQNPALWFSQVECIFANRNVTREFNRYCLVVEALPHESLRMVADLVERAPADNPYTALKARLLSAHQQTDFQRAELLFDMPALGSRKPSQLMAAMLEVCPRGAEKCILFPCLFLRRLPRELRVLLARADHTDLKALAEQADELWALHAQEEPVAAVQQLQLEEEAVAAVRNSGPHMQAPKGGHWQKKKPKKQGAEESVQSKEASLTAGICLPHWRYGASARFCNNPCSWQGN